MKSCLMVQGTMSGVGKSLLTAGLCRLLWRDGYRVAPFKSQNMALNSFITAEGLEMGRAQVLQARAAGIAPSVRMNPILLKPTRENSSQVIVEGKPIGTMPAREYFAMKKSLLPVIERSFASLQEEADVVVIEGAGSPAEINLKKDDIVNMGIARLFDAPVLLAGDIDRGGVFAQLYGTLALLEPEERERVKGLVINKFRGDVGILKPGLTQLSDLCHCPVAGVVPYLNLSLEEEDSLTDRFTRKAGEGPLRAAVIRLPHISNFTDFDALESLPGLSLFYAASPWEVLDVDLILLPGTKNTLGDLRWLKETSFDALLQREADKGTLIMGICGGYQMLGESLSDPEGVEEGGSTAGLGLLPMTTVFSKEKIRTQAEGRIHSLSGPFAPFSGLSVTGYEIHQGNSLGRGETSAEPVLTAVNTLTGEEKEDGMAAGNVLGTYVHGFFDAAPIQEALLSILAAHRGISLDAVQGEDREARTERELDLLADTLRESLDLSLLYRILEERDRG